MILRQWIYRVSPKFIKKRLLLKMVDELAAIQLMLVPNQMKSYDQYLKALYDFGSTLPVGLVKDFNHFRLTNISTYFESSLKAAEALTTLINFNEIWRLSQYPDVLLSLRSMDEFYANNASIQTLLDDTPALLIYLTLLYGNHDFKGTPAEEALTNLNDDHKALLRGRVSYRVVVDYATILQIVIESNLEALRGTTTR